MNKLTIAILLAATLAASHLSAQSLDQIKIAADAGDPVAQDKLAERDTANAEMWYRKAAAQGYAHAQGKLSFILLLRAQTLLNLKPNERQALANEGIKWAVLAANQGDKLGEANLARVYLEGKFLKQDYIEAYKWGDLSDKNPSIEFTVYSGAFTRDAAILKMNADQIAEAKRRVAEFQPHAPQKTETPVPASVSKLKLQGISGGPQKRFATISGKTVEKGESDTVTINGHPTSFRCVEITDTSATVVIEGVEGRVTLNLQ